MSTICHSISYKIFWKTLYYYYFLLFPFSGKFFMLSDLIHTDYSAPRIRLALSMRSFVGGSVPSKV